MNKTNNTEIISIEHLILKPEYMISGKNCFNTIPKAQACSSVKIPHESVLVSFKKPTDQDNKVMSKDLAARYAMLPDNVPDAYAKDDESGSWSDCETEENPQDTDPIIEITDPYARRVVVFQGREKGIQVRSE